MPTLKAGQDGARPIYRQLAALGHAGRADIDLPWEQLDRAQQLKQAAQAMGVQP